jgi:flagellar biosynthesis/type III secretory pathway M-ring protein FliF/YscJ
VIKPMMKIFSAASAEEPVLLEQLRPRPALPPGTEGGEVPMLAQNGETGLQKGMDRKQIFQSVEEDPTKAAEIVKSWLHEKG